MELLIRRLPDAIAAGAAGISDISTRNDSRMLLFGPLYYSSPQVWDELFRCLAAMDGVQRKHLIARYHGGSEVRRQVRFIERKAHGRTVALDPVQLPPCTEVITTGGADGSSKALITCIVHQWPAWVSNQLVTEALRSLDHAYRGSVDVPKELIAA